MQSSKTVVRARPNYEYSGASITATNEKEALPDNRFFVYGIFLGQSMRDSFGMYNAQYATVQGFVTRGRGIVAAERTDDAGLALTGLTLSINPDNIPALDRLEGGYDRIAVHTNDGERVWMYAKPGTVSD